MLFDLTAIDERQHFHRQDQRGSDFTVVYHLLSYERNADVRIKVAVTGSAPSLATVTDLWPAANWYECEVWDMFGITFEGHPHLRRILMPPTWNGHPLRKDHPARAMAAHAKVAVGYNIQVAVDAKNRMIVDQEVTNQVVDMGLLTQTAEPARAILEVETIDVVADRGYFKIEDIEACEKAGMTPYVPKPQRGSSVSNGFFRKDEFRYDGARRIHLSGRPGPVDAL